mmetsp:Transcript_35297/g.48999  ORF Transcript_35297/g.48999 Transcript_35297/m.48999 type:complete len:258 (+) Transcript_35297:124-897(+)|eukprot:CAMPEP_0196599654 /NCGR_PEP_ID=MMETSP1081-20130531/94970_1 /TAXON_ID=36882 /ORGANISM="Pyramimonas amylifera, Strain CCMP720" /LENGTH=257 /DNA_ID=CAMNT_0041925437 /DNA_START=575 /DNA_END=1348 /DNA_ORIENTATION=-
MTSSIMSVEVTRGVSMQSPRLQNTKAGCSMLQTATRTFSAPTKISLQGAFTQGETSLSMSGFPSTVSTQRTSLRVNCGDSRIGKLPITVPAGVTYKLEGQKLSVKGKLGEMHHEFPNLIECVEDGPNVLVVRKTQENITSRQLHGLSRSLAQNMVTGVSEGHQKKLQLIGVGYRAAMQGKNIQLSLGYSHPLIMEPPEGVTIACDSATMITISGYDKAVVGNFAAIIRSKRPPEPYKGKGVKYIDEYIIRKEGKSGK